MRRPVLPILVLAVLPACGCGGPGAAASCAGPSAVLDPARAAVGAEVTLAVEWLHDGCNDYSGADEERPRTDVPVTFVQGDSRVPLGTVSGTGERYSGSLTAPVPREAVPGAAAVVVGEGDRVTVELTVLP